MSEAALLPCGRDPLDVADHAVAGTLDEHERECPWCQAEAATGLASSRLGSEAAGLEVVDPPRELVSNAMRSVRAELRTSRELPVPSPFGAAFVTDHVVTAVLRDALDAAGGLVVASCRIAVADGGGLQVRVEAYGRYPDDLAAEAGIARRVVTSTLRREFELHAAGGVDVAVVDLIGPVS